MITFAVSDVKVGGLKRAIEREGAVRSLLAAPVEAVSGSERRMVACTDVNALAQAAHDAFYEHLPLVLTPDAVWLCIAQGFARHVNLHAEELRGRFVRHAGRQRIVVEHTGVALGRPSPWTEVFALFSDALAARLGTLRELVVADFSTTDAVARAASQITLMDAFQGYFEYELRFGCGIPAITLTGCADDWRAIRRRAQVLSEYGLADWIDVLVPVLDRIVATAEGTIDVDFWRSFFRHRSGSGASELTGWIVTLFPYLDELGFDHRRSPAPAPTAERSSGGEVAAEDMAIAVDAHLRSPRTTRTPVWNRHLAHWWDEHARASANARWPQRIGPGLSQFPSSLASAPVRLVDVRTGEETMARFVGGLVGVVQDERTLALEPEVGWAVVRDSDA